MNPDPVESQQLPYSTASRYAALSMQQSRLSSETSDVVFTGLQPPTNASTLKFVQRNDMLAANNLPKMGGRKTSMYRDLLTHTLRNSLVRPCGVFAMHIKKGRFYDVDLRGMFFVFFF